MGTEKYISLLINRQKGDLSTEELKQLEDWLHADPKHQLLADQVLADWENSQMAAPALDVDVAGDFEKFKSRMHQAKQAQAPAAKVIPMQRKSRQWIWVAASVALLAGAFLTLRWNSSPKEMTLQAGISQTRNVTLVDGTKVWLNSNSTLTYTDKFKGSNRLVQLSGEAYFEVSKNEKQAFIVQIDQAQVKVLGTAFNILEDKKKNRIELSVSEGRVAFSSRQNGKNLVVSAKESASYSIDNGSLEMGRSQPNAAAWQSGMLSFAGVKLEYVLQDVEKYFGRKVTLQNDSLKDCIFGGNFPKPNVDGVLTFIANSFDMQLTQDRNGDYQLNEGECIQK